MEIVLVRHGEPEWVVDGLNIDHPPLTERGRRQAARMADALAGETFDEILVSPLERARETAAPLYTRFGRQQVIEPWLEEIRSPVWQGTPREKAEVAFAEERSRPSHLRWSGLAELGGEANSDFIAMGNMASGAAPPSFSQTAFVDYVSQSPDGAFIGNRALLRQHANSGRATAPLTRSSSTGASGCTSIVSS